MQSLNDLRELLPIGHHIAAVDHYSIREAEQYQGTELSWTSQNSQEPKELMGKVMSQMHQMLSLKEELYYYKTEFFKLAKESSELNDMVRNIGGNQDKHLEMVKELQKTIKDSYAKNQ